MHSRFTWFMILVRCTWEAKYHNYVNAPPFIMRSWVWIPTIPLLTLLSCWQVSPSSITATQATRKSVLEADSTKIWPCNHILEEGYGVLGDFSQNLVMVRHPWLGSVTVIDRGERVCYKSMPPLLPWQHGQSCSLEPLETDGCVIIGIRTSNRRANSFLLCHLERPEEAPKCLCLPDWCDTS